MRIRGGTLLRLWACALLIVASNSMFAANWYVKLGGNNASSGASWANAKASINAMVNSPNVGNGDIIFIEGGIYTEQVVIGNKSITLLGSQDSNPLAPQGRTTIASPAYSAMTGYTFGTALSWNGAGKLSSNTIRPVVFVNASNSSVNVNIQQIDISGSGASMPEGSTEMLVGLAYRFAGGTVGGSSANQVSIKNFNATAETNGLNNAFGAMILTRSAVTFSHVIVEDYRNAGIAVVGENLSTASSVIANQPNPTIIDCEVKGQTINGISNGDFIQSGILIANGARATVKRTLVWQNRTNGLNNASDRFAYGIYLNDARTVLIGETTTNKANGNLITDNEIGIYVRINSTAVSATGYTIRQNTIAYNGNETPSGRLSSYGNETAANTTYGAVRFYHMPVTNQTLSVTNNAWGNSEAHLFFSANSTAADYSHTSYAGTRVAFWNQDKGDQITFTSPLSPLYGETLYVHQSNSPKNAVPGASNGTNGIGVNLEFGFFNFSQLNRAVYAAREQAGTGNTPNIHVKSNTTEDETAVITKSINIFGDSTACGSQSTIQLASSLNMPIVWAYGLNTQTTAPNNNSDAVTRTPSGITLKFLNFAPNNVQSSGSATPGTGPAMLVTGASGGTQTPIGVQLYGCAMSPVFDGSPLAISTDQDGSLTGRYAAHPVTIDAKFTKKTNNCDLLLVDNDVRDYRDDPILSLIMLDDIINITTNCADLQSAINNASLASPRTTIRVMTNLNCPMIEANTTAKVRIETIAPFVLTIGTFNLNNGGGQGGNVAVCGMEVNTESSGITTIQRVNVWPPACLHDAVNIVTDNPSHVVVAANSNAVVGALPFTESTVDTMNYVILQKRFDMFVATGATAINPSPASANQTFTGRFIIQDRLRHDGVLLGIADIPVVSGTMQSTRGLAFGDTSAQVELMHNRVFGDLTNYNASFTPYYGGNIEMAQQFINDNDGSRRLNFYNSSFGTQNARIWKRVFANGLANRGTQTGLIRLEGSGNCSTSGPDASSVLRNLSIAQVDVATNTDCIQTAIGRVISCDSSYQDIEGAGTNSVDGSGGMVHLFNINTFAQNVEIAKSITINEGTAFTSGVVTLRRGAIVYGSIDEFTNTVNLNQCYSAHSNGANPNPVDGLKVANSSPSSVMNIAGYGNTNPVGQGSQARGVWQFDNVWIYKDVNIRGTNWNVLSNLLTTDCSLLSSTTFPGVNPVRDLSVETVIGGDNNSGYSSGHIFIVNSSGVDIDGFSFKNLYSSDNAAVYIWNAWSGNNDIQINNNILNSNQQFSHCLVSGWYNVTASDIDITNNHVTLNWPATAPWSNGITLYNVNDAGSVVNNIQGNAVSIENAGMGVVLRLGQINATNSTSGFLVKNNFLTGGTSHGIRFDGGGDLNGITVEQNMIYATSNGVEVLTYTPPGTNGITIRENIITGNGTGVLLSGDYTTVDTNRIFVNNNNLADNYRGVYVDGITNNNTVNTNMFDLRFNYWGSDLGPQRGNGIATNPLLAPSDSSRIIGHVPFNHTTGSFIEDINGSTHGRWMIYPVAVTATDSSTACGWKASTMMGPVLRLNAAGNTLLGMYNKIAEGRDDASALAYPAVRGARTGTDQLVIVAGSTYNSANYGYDGSASIETTYPVQFTNDLDRQPSIIRGLNRPRILGSGTGTGSIAVTSTFPRGFQLLDFVEHVGRSSNYTAISFANGFSNKVDYNFITAINAAPATFKGITCTNTAANVAQTFTNNRINLGQNPRWPGGPAVAVSAPSEFTGIEVPSHGGNGSVTINNNELSVPSTAPKSVGIYVNAQNNITNSVNINFNQIRKMAAGSPNVGRTSYWGTGIYLAGGDIIEINSNDIQGTGGGAGHDGITLDKPGTGSVNSNILSTLTGQNFGGVNATTTRERGYGIKLYSSTGTDAIGSITMNGNNIGSADAVAPDVASIYVGGTSSTIGSAASPVVISNNTILNGRNSANAVVQIATVQYAGASSAGYVTIENNTIGSVTSGQSNAMFLAIGTDGVGVGRTGALADNISVNVRNNAIRTSEQAVIIGATREVADARPNAGMNIRNIFGIGTGSATNGASTPGNGNSGNNTFTHATILTSEPNHANYTYYTSGLSRTAKAVALGDPSTTPVTIERLIATPLNVAGWADTANTVELRENAGFNINTAELYYNESLTFPDRRILVSGPRTGTNRAELLPSGGGTGTIFTSNGRENKDIRGAIRMNAIGAGLFGRVSVGAANKGDVYLQLDNVGADNTPVSFRYHATTLGSQVAVTGLNNSLTKTLDIKAGMDDADDDGFAANGSTTRRTGVFRSGTGTSQFLKETPEAITGANVLNVYPNPASGDVTVSFHIPVEGAVRLALYNALGEKVTDLREEYLRVDNYTTSFSGANLPSGTYHVRLVHDLFTRTVPVTIIK